MSRPRVLVAGGGLAGLTAASVLCTAGVDVVLVEAAPQLGGRLALTGHTTVIHAGAAHSFPIEHGMHNFWRRYVNARALLARHRLLGELVPVDGQEVVTRLDGPAVHHLELGRRVSSSRLPHSLAFAGGLAQHDILLSLIRGGGLPFVKAGLNLLHGFAYHRASDTTRFDHLTAADFLAGCPAAIQALFVAIIHSCYFAEPREVSLASFFDCFQHYFALDKRDTTSHTLRGGTHASLLMPLATDLRRAGVDLRLRTRLVHLDAPLGSAVLAPEGRHPVRVPLDGAVLALDAPGLQALVARGALPPGTVTGRIPRARGSVVVRLWFDRTPAHRHADSGVFHGLGASNFFWLDRLQAPFQAWRRHTGGTALECHVYADLASEAEHLDDDVVAARAETAALAAWPDLAGARVAAHVLRNPPSHTHFAPGTMSGLPAVTTPVPGLALAGDFIAAPGTGMYMERAVLTGLLAARSVAADVGVSPDALPEPVAEPGVSLEIRGLQQASRVLRAGGVLAWGSPALNVRG